MGGRVRRRGRAREGEVERGSKPRVRQRARLNIVHSSEFAERGRGRSCTQSPRVGKEIHLEVVGSGEKGA